MKASELAAALRGLIDDETRDATPPDVFGPLTKADLVRLVGKLADRLDPPFLVPEDNLVSEKHACPECGQRDSDHLEILEDDESGLQIRCDCGLEYIVH